MDCGGRSPQAISLKFLLDRWNCLETIMQCFDFFFSFFFFKKKRLSVWFSICLSQLLFSCTWLGKKKIIDWAKRIAPFFSFPFFHNCACNYLSNARAKQKYKLLELISRFSERRFLKESNALLFIYLINLNKRDVKVLALCSFLILDTRSYSLNEWLFIWRFKWLKCSLRAKQFPSCLFF